MLLKRLKKQFSCWLVFIDEDSALIIPLNLLQNWMQTCSAETLVQSVFTNAFMETYPCVIVYFCYTHRVVVCWRITSSMHNMLECTWCICRHNTPNMPDRTITNTHTYVHECMPLTTSTTSSDCSQGLPTPSPLACPIPPLSCTPSSIYCCFMDCGH